MATLTEREAGKAIFRPLKRTFDIPDVPAEARIPVFDAAGRSKNRRVLHMAKRRRNAIGKARHVSSSEK